VSDAVIVLTAATDFAALAARRPPRAGPPGRSDQPPPAPEDDDRPPVCPVCNKRLVILATHPGRDAAGRPIRKQLWGCPRGHATTYRVGGVFEPIELLDDLYS
jgi:hypothetical protein